MNFNDKRVAEEATGIRQNPAGLGKFYFHGGQELDPRDVPRVIQMGYHIEVPNAGAGSYREFFTDLAGYEDVKTVETTSSAGDWTLAVSDASKWYLAFQTNRHPYSGFDYSVDKGRWWTTFKDLCEALD